MKAETKYKILLHNHFFELGYNKTHYVKWVIAIMGFTSREVNYTAAGLGIYAIGCYLLGRWYMLTGLKEIEAEIGNRFNKFTKDMRKKFKLSEKFV
ncbi:hypothetical protein LCGC14_1487880 [marine sediment metagenome]|uniref:Uncharacterized protein n=1 Tax=marine sediment metagenome TaxID=412755 RepID=A0A0F9LNC5_9ZZZZ